MGFFVTCLSSLLTCLCWSSAHLLARGFVLFLLGFGSESLLGVRLCDREEQGTQQARAGSRSPYSPRKSQKCTQANK